MSELKYVIVNVVETLLRFLPLSCRTGLIEIGNPDKNSPILLTCNYHLTVERVKKAVKGMDCYLLVANSRGVNVWCASAGGLLTNHDVISVLKTSGIEDMTKKRTVVLPQLAAAGVESRIIKKKTGWTVIWGPVRAEDIPEFIENNQKTSQMTEVVYDLQQRMEMSAAWAFPASIVLGLVLALAWPEAVIRSILFVWGVSFLVNGLFPFYSRWLGKRVFFIDFERGGLFLMVWGVFIGFVVLYSILKGFSWGVIIKWAVVSLVVIFVLTFDVRGNTPVYKSGIHEERLLAVFLNEEKCRGAGVCEQVCPRNCFTVKKGKTAVKRDRCVKCGACIVQCPFDALSFKNAEGGTITPETIRRFKLNLMGSRLVKVKK